MWLRDMLPAALQQYGISFRVMSYGYRTELSDESSIHFLDKIPVELESALEHEGALVGLSSERIMISWIADHVELRCSHPIPVS